MDRKGTQDGAEWIEKSIKEYARSPLNSLQNKGNEIAWGEPLVGFSRGDDSLYAQLRSMIGDFYWQPETIFGLAFPQADALPEELSVISWVLPQTDTTKADNRKETVFGSERWVRSQNLGKTSIMPCEPMW